ncbi:MAG: DUF4256 domain-containing protein, partial [Clostridiales bacterium]|nr:DUF4256 domain-containing protein [Clostridiales bacterium]
MNNDKKHLLKDEYETLIASLKERFEKNMDRHEKIEWSKVESRLEKSPDKIWSLNEMEQTG